MEHTPIDKETKIFLLNAIKKGYFTEDDKKFLQTKAGFSSILLEIIDKREQVDL